MNNNISKKWCKDQESIQSSTTPDPGYQWESDKLTEDTTNESQEVSPFPAGDHKAHINRHAQNIAKMHTKIICNISFGRFDVHLQVLQPILKFPYLISLIKFPQICHLKCENHLKECHLWLTLKWIRKKYRVSSMFAFRCIIWTLLHVFART